MEDEKFIKFVTIEKMGILFKKILISVLAIAVFAAPFSSQIKSSERGISLNIEKNEASAESVTELFGNSKIEDVIANSNSVTFNAKIILNDNEGSSKSGNAGTWKSTDGEGEWKLLKGREGKRGEWVADSTIRAFENKGVWKSDNESGQSGTWEMYRSSGTWTATKGKGGVGTGIWNASPELDFYDNLGGTARQPATGILFRIKNLDNPREEVREYYLTTWKVFFNNTKTENSFVGLKTPTNLKPNTNYSIQLVMKANAAFDDFENNPIPFRTAPENSGDTKDDNATVIGESTSSGEGAVNNYDLGCNILTGDGFIGCVASIFYTAWEASALIARLAGHFLDFFVYYSTDSDSYDNGFVSLAWAGVRDIANIFFIISLLYVGIKTILGLNVTNNRKIISAVIVIALVINFSLFVTKVVIDGSNILAKVFYNNITPKDENTGNLKVEEGGQKSISVGLIDKYNPQQIIETEAEYNQGRGEFIFITILLLAVTLYTAYVFFSVAFLFVSRVVSLWIAMIFSPLAFISYAVPFNIPEFGSKKWWTNLLENAFLAPVFIFFLYIIVLFAGFLKGITIYPTGSDTMQRIMSVVIPFAILTALLQQAKKIAVQYAGEMGKMIQGAAAAVGGLALGGGALTTAALGRATVGKLLQKASTSDSASKYEQYKAGNIAQNQLSFKDKTFGRIGNKLNESQKKIESSAHARHELNTEAKNRYGKEFKQLTGTERDVIRERIASDKQAEAQYGKKYSQLDLYEKAHVDNAIRTDLANKTSKADELIEKSKKKQGALSNVAQSMRTGSYDIRNIAKVTPGEQDKFINKLSKGVLMATAIGIRSGLKSTLNINYGESQKNLLKDIGNTVSSALKSAKIEVDLSHVGKVEKEHVAGHGGGGHH